MSARPLDPAESKRIWRERRMHNSPLDQSGVWRYRELIPFLDDDRHVVTLREGNTPLLKRPKAPRLRGPGSADVQTPGV